MPEVDCSQIDIEQVEEIGLAVAKHVQDMVVNVDMSSVQFDLNQMYEEAQRLGLDEKDLEEFGYNKSSLCGDSKCTLDLNKIKDYDKYISNTEVLGERLSRVSGSAYKTAMCSPYFKENIHPKVQFFWAMFPFDCCFGFCPHT